MSFYVLREGREYGPLTPEQLRLGLAQGRLVAGDPCRPVHVSAWATVADFSRPASAVGVKKSSLLELLAEDDAEVIEETPRQPLPQQAVVAIVLGLLAVACWFFWPRENAPAQPEVKGTTAPPAANHNATSPKPPGATALAAHTRLVPADSVAVLTVRLAGLLENADAIHVRELPLWPAAEAAILQYSPYAGRVLRDAAGMGLDTSAPIHVFLKLRASTNAPGGLEATVGVTAAVADLGLLDAHLPVILHETLGGFGEALARNPRREGDHWIMASRNVPVALAYNEQHLVLVSRHPAGPAEGLEPLLKEILAAATPLANARADFQAHCADPLDAGLWVNLAAARGLAQRLDSAAAGELLAGTETIDAAALGITFKQGAAEFSLRLPLTADARAALLNKLPAAPREWLAGPADVGYENFPELMKTLGATGAPWNRFRELRHSIDETAPGQWRLTLRFLLADPEMHSLRALRTGEQ